MKQVLTTLIVMAVLNLTACTKTENATTAMTTTHPRELDVEVEIDRGEMTILMNGEIMRIDDFENNIDGEVQVHMIVNDEEVDGMPHDMMAHVMQMIGGHGKPHGEWRRHNRESSEEHQFMEELGTLSTVSEYLEDNNAVALMGIHMIRDELEGEVRMEALEEIIEESGSGSAVRNAALIVAIQTMQEVGDEEAASDLMVELVLSN